jgi:CubicO group peptidase (beta-lactamase class C family)
MKMKPGVFLFGAAALIVASTLIASPSIPPTARVVIAENAAISTGAVRKFSYSAFAGQPKGLSWPTKEWERGPVDSRVDATKLNALLDAIDKPKDPSFGKSYALLLIHKGKIVAERYAADYDCEQSVHTMSVGKMMGAAMAGVLVRDGHAKLDGPLGLSQWAKQDPRTNITFRNALNMATGLGWEEDGDGSFLELAFGSGYKDLAGYTASQPLRHEPGTFFEYSDGTPSFVGAIARQTVGKNRSEVAKWVKQEILTPAGMTKTELEFDKQGVWYGSSGVRWSTCDLGRFGYMLLREGEWDGKKILPSGWVNAMRTPSEASIVKPLPPGAPPEAALYYGFFSFVWDLRPADFAKPKPTGIPVDAFGHYGWGGSALRVVPSRDVVLVAVGFGAPEETDMLRKDASFKAITDLFPIVETSIVQANVAS